MKDYKHCIVVDQTNRPMAWGGEQLCYCTDEEWEDPHPVSVLKVKTARDQIRKSIAYRRKMHYDVDDISYCLMPVKK